MRSLWKGSLSFGLVNIPIRLYTGSREKELDFVMLHKTDMGPIRYARICKTEDKEVPWKDIVKGFEYKKGEYIVLTEEDFKKASLKKTETIEILSFVNEDEVDPVFYDKPYLLEPDKGGSKAYILLREALNKSGKVGVASYVMHNHERIGVIKPYKNALILNQLRYATEVVNPDNLEIPESSKIPSAEMDIALKLINQLTHKFQPEKYHDTYVDQLMDVIQKKAKGKKIVRKGEEKAPAPSKVHDIMSLLKASLDKPERGEKQTKRKKKSVA